MKRNSNSCFQLSTARDYFIDRTSIELLEMIPGVSKTWSLRSLGLGTRCGIPWDR